MTNCSRAGACADSNYPFLTSKERDIETGLDYFLARYYSSTQGRFTGPDQPFVGQYEDDPQSWNLYTYVGNNPLVFTDPFGLWKWAGTDNNGNRLIQWEEGDNEYSLSRFLEQQTGVYYYPSDLKKAYFSSGEALGPNTIVDASGVPRGFTNTGGLVDTSWDFYLTVLPAAGGAKAAGGLIKGAGRGLAGLFTREAVTETTSLGLSTAARAATGFATKAAARAAVNGLAASPAAKAAARKAISRATANSTIEVVEEAGTVYVRIKRAGFDGYQVVESVIKSNGTKEVVQKAYDAAGRIVHYDPK